MPSVQWRLAAVDLQLSFASVVHSSRLPFVHFNAVYPLVSLSTSCYLPSVCPSILVFIRVNVFWCSQNISSVSFYFFHLCNAIKDNRLLLTCIHVWPWHFQLSQKARWRESSATFPRLLVSTEMASHAGPPVTSSPVLQRLILRHLWRPCLQHWRTRLKIRKILLFQGDILLFVLLYLLYQWPDFFVVPATLCLYQGPDCFVIPVVCFVVPLIWLVGRINDLIIGCTSVLIVL